MGYETEAWRKPALQPDDTEIFSEPGRSMNGIDYRSHWFVLVKPKFGFYTLLVKHGGGEERLPLNHSKQLVSALQCLSSDDRYFILHNFLDLAHKAARKAEAAAAQYYRSAFAEDRLKKRKMPGREAFKIWINPPLTGSVTLPIYIFYM